MFDDDDLMDIIGYWFLGYILGAIVVGIGYLCFFLCKGLYELGKCIYNNRHSIAARIKSFFTSCKRPVEKLYGPVKNLLVHKREEVRS